MMKLKRPLFLHFALLVSITLVLLLTGCSVHQQPNNNPFYKEAFARLDTMQMVNAIPLLDSLSAQFSYQPPGSEDLANYYKKKVQFYRNKFNQKEALLASDSLLKLLNQHEDAPFYKKHYADALIQTSDLYAELKRYDESIELLVRAKVFIEKKLQDNCLQSQYLSNIAAMLFNQNKYLLAAEYYIQAWLRSEQCTDNAFDRFYQGYSNLSNAGIAYSKVKYDDSAMYYFNKALLFIADNESAIPGRADYVTLCKGVVSSNMGNVMLHRKQYDEAERLFSFAREATQKEYPAFAFGALMGLADVYIESGNVNKAKATFYQVDSIAGAKPEVLQKLGWNLNLRKKKYYELLGDYKTALLYNNMYLAKRDSVDDVAQKNIARDTGLEFTAKEQKSINETLRKQNENTSFQLFIALLAVTIILLIATFIWVLLRRKSKYAKALELLNKEIEFKNQDIKEAYASLERSYNVNTRITRTVAHDLKNPLSGIANVARNLAKREQSNDIKETLSLIVSASENSIGLINEMELQSATKAPEISREMNDIFHLLEHCVALMKPQAIEKKQRLYLNGEHLMVNINKDKMWRVFTNIINNAIKFSHEKSSIYVTLQRKNEGVLLSVQDYGIGIPENLKDKVIEAMPESQRTGTFGETSYGLGLSISKKIVEEHNGKLWFESKEGEGTTFFVLLPSNN